MGPGKATRGATQIQGSRTQNSLTDGQAWAERITPSSRSPISSYDSKTKFI